MPHWTDYSTRGWLSFLGFMHIGLSIRSLFDPSFLYDKVFNLSRNTFKEPILTRFFGVISLCQALMLFHAAIHLYVLPVQVTAMSTMLAFISLVMMEAFYYQTLDFYGGTLLPFCMSITSFIWLMLFHFVWKPWLQYTISEDCSLKTLLHESKRKYKAQSAATIAGNTATGEHYFRNEIHYLKRSSTGKAHDD